MALYHRTPPGDSSQAKYNASRKEEIPPILPPQPDNIAGSLTGNNKIHDVGKNLWEGEAFAEQRALKRQVGASPVPTPGSEFDEYGGMFAQPLAQTGEIKAANKQRRQDRRQRVKDIKAAGGPENYSFKELMEILLIEVRKKRFLVNIPYSIAKFQSYFLQMMPNPLLTPDQVELLKFDNLVSGDYPTLNDLGIMGTPIQNILSKYIYRFREGGQFG